MSLFKMPKELASARISFVLFMIFLLYLVMRFCVFCVMHCGRLLWLGLIRSRYTYLLVIESLYISRLL